MMKMKMREWMLASLTTLFFLFSLTAAQCNYVDITTNTFGCDGRGGVTFTVTTRPPYTGTNVRFIVTTGLEQTFQGPGPYTHTWYNLPAMTHNIRTMWRGVLGQAEMSCEVVTPVSIPSGPYGAPAPRGTAEVVPTTCWGTSNGAIFVSASGGTAPYTYALNNSAPSVSNTFTGLIAGEYTVRVLDANKCTFFIPAFITTPPAISMTNTITSPTCAGNDGAISIYVSGGSAPYSYRYNGVPGGSSKTGLEAGTYNIGVRDSNECSSVTTVVLFQPPPVDECLTGPCDVNAVCFDHYCSYECQCNIGYQGDGFSCIDVNECEENVCNQNATCTNKAGGYECNCLYGFEGDGFSCIDINECEMELDMCGPIGICENYPGYFTCSCPAGYVRSGIDCIDINECILPTSNCSVYAICTNKIGSYECNCLSGFEGDGHYCTDTDECTLNTNDCSAYATCSNTIGSYQCYCTSGFEGDGRNCTDVDECTLNTNDCSAYATCSNTFGGYECFCLSGFVGDGHNCTDIDECTLQTNDCSAYATCSNTIGSYECYCLSGFVGDGHDCIDVDECEDSICGQGTCENFIGSFNCTCLPGYETSYGTNCEDVDECLHADACPEMFYCINYDGAYGCEIQ